MCVIVSFSWPVVAARRLSHLSGHCLLATVPLRVADNGGASRKGGCIVREDNIVTVHGYGVQRSRTTSSSRGHLLQLASGTRRQGRDE